MVQHEVGTEPHGVVGISFHGLQMLGRLGVARSDVEQLNKLRGSSLIVSGVQLVFVMYSLIKTSADRGSLGRDARKARKLSCVLTRSNRYC